MRMLICVLQLHIHGLQMSAAIHCACMHMRTYGSTLCQPICRILHPESKPDKGDRHAIKQPKTPHALLLPHPAQGRNSLIRNINALFKPHPTLATRMHACMQGAAGAHPQLGLHHHTFGCVL